METETADFSVDIPAEKADALLCEWAPDPDLFTFPRLEACYCWKVCGGRSHNEPMRPHHQLSA